MFFPGLFVCPSVNGLPGTQKLWMNCNKISESSKFEATHTSGNSSDTSLLHDSTAALKF